MKTGGWICSCRFLVQPLQSPKRWFPPKLIHGRDGCKKNKPTLSTLHKGTGQIRLLQFLWQQKRGWIFSLCSGPPEPWAWLNSGAFSGVSSYFFSVKKIISKIQRQRVWIDIKLSSLKPHGGGWSFFSEDLKTKGLPEVILAVWWFTVQPPIHTFSPTWPGRCHLPAALHPQRRKEMSHTQTTTATHRSSRVESEPLTFLPSWLFLFSQAI